LVFFEKTGVTKNKSRITRFTLSLKAQFFYICILRFVFMTLRIVFKYSLIAGCLIVLFAILKSEWLYSGLYPDLFLTLIALVFTSGGIWISRLMLQKEQVQSVDPHAEQQSRLRQLSKREQEVLVYLYSRYTNKEIADMMHIELSTLKTHINSIYRKLGVKNRKDLPPASEPAGFFN
jgi:DNA-binding CsgD family transcriptional regulator